MWGQLPATVDSSFSSSFIVGSLLLELKTDIEEDCCFLAASLSLSLVFCNPTEGERKM